MRFMLYAWLLALLASCSSLQTPQYKASDEKVSSNEKTESRDGIVLGWPLRGVIDLTRGYLSGFQPHQGIDLAAPKGSKVRSAHAGYVEYAGHDFSGYGNLVIVNSGYGWSTFYAHLQKINVKMGQKIARTQLIGTVGNTGNARGVHLHFELRYKEKPVDPLEYLPQSKTSLSAR